MGESICEIHGKALRETVVPIRYGLPPPDPANAIRRELFPNARFHVNGGCMIDDEAECTVPVCDECREAETAWRAENEDATASFQGRAEVQEIFRGRKRS